MRCWSTKSLSGLTRPPRKRAGLKPLTSPGTWSRNDLLQVRAQLNYIDPPIWRRLLLPGSVTFAGLHNVLQTAFGWTDSHLHRFSRGRTELREGNPIGEVFGKKNDAVLYEYDFGDSWEVQLILEDLLPPAEADRPTCVDGARAAPLEDCGGVPGYHDLLKALADPEHPDHDDLVEWSGGNYQPEAFDRDAINRALASLRRLR